MITDLPRREFLGSLQLSWKILSPQHKKLESFPEIRQSASKKVLNLMKISQFDRTGFFLTPATKKTKTQAQNSSQKLKKKTQPQGGNFLRSRKTQEKT